MREVVAWCDVCMKDGLRTPATAEYVLAITLGKTTDQRAIELCGTHVASIMEPWKSVMEYGRKPAAAATQPALPTPMPDSQPEKRRPTGIRARRANCPICGKEMYANSIPEHFASHHGVSKIAHPTVCPDCGIEQTAPQAMGNHRVVRHGWDIVEEYFSAYRAAQAKPTVRPRRKVSRR